MDSAIGSVTSLRHRISSRSGTQENDLHWPRADSHSHSIDAAGRCRLSIDGYSAPVIELRPLCVVIHSAEPIALDARAVNAQLLVGESPVRELSVTYLSRQSDADGWLTVLAIDGEPVDPEYVRGLTAAHAALGDVAGTHSMCASVPESFRMKVHELVGLLEALEQRVADLEAAQEPLSIEHRDSVHKAVAQVVAEHLRDELANFWSAYYDMLSEMDADQRARAVEYCRERAQRFFRQSPFVERSNRKPRGYAGDFEMMNLIYRNETLGDSLFAKCIHRYFIGHPNAEAVRNRAEYLAEELTASIGHWGGEPLRVLSVASGPAREIALLLEQGVDLSNVEFELLDQDPEALSDAYHRIARVARKTGRTVSLRLTEKRIKEFIKEESRERYDFIYSAGLFDYLPDDTAVAAARRMYSLLKPGGRLIIGNFRGVDRHKATMEIAMDWHLIYRTTEDLRRLFGQLGDMTVDAEPEGINLFARVWAREE